ncbi:endonuclease/exonuclease/phosphatase family protein, partial [Francisella tularensis]|uniref:endonuclease/exonuclease/phosphatase family protein n=1 Tax=Francisella tularensis TaxID=263 RepID=UPI0023AB7BF5|nr:exodeoxyribonuclease III [Francisella tularensis subsp. holarctica]
HEPGEAGRDFIVCGDFNIVHTEIDIKNWQSKYGKTSGVLTEEQAWLDHIFDDLGWFDNFRVINHEPLTYSWLSNRGQ